MQIVQVAYQKRANFSSFFILNKKKLKFLTPLNRDELFFESYLFKRKEDA